MESGVYYTRRVLQTYGNVFWVDELSSNISGYVLWIKA